MQDLPLTALRALAAVYLTGGIRSAGRHLGIAHSSVARHLSELEARVGAPILEDAPGRRRVVFTALGNRLGRDAADALAALDGAWQAACERRSPHSVVISAAPSVAALWLLPRLPALAEAVPTVDVSVLAEQRPRGPEAEGCDLTLRMGAPPADAPAAPLMDDALTPVIAPRLLARARAARGGHARWDTLLKDLPLLHDRDPNAGWDRWVGAFGPSELDTARGPRFASSDLVLRAAQQRQGVALARLRLARDSLRAGALVRLSDQSVALPGAYHLIGRSDRAQRPAVRRVWDWLLAEARREDTAPEAPPPSA